MLSQRPLVINRDNRKKKFIILGGILLAVVISIVAALELTDTTHLFHTAKIIQAPTASQETKGEPAAPDADDKSSTSKNPAGPASSSEGKPADTQSTKEGNGASSSAPLVTPSGNFVSAHKVPSDAPIASVCNTTPGASCKITFTMNGTTKSLSTETADRGGSVYWNSWTPASIGLAAGSWKIEAIATSSGQTKTATDALPLEVSP